MLSSTSTKPRRCTRSPWPSSPRRRSRRPTRRAGESHPGEGSASPGGRAAVPPASAGPVSAARRLIHIHAVHAIAGAEETISAATAVDGNRQRVRTGHEGARGDPEGERGVVAPIGADRERARVGLGGGAGGLLRAPGVHPDLGARAGEGARDADAEGAGGDLRGGEIKENGSVVVDA